MLYIYTYVCLCVCVCVCVWVYVHVYLYVYIIHIADTSCAPAWPVALSETPNQRVLNALSGSQKHNTGVHLTCT